MENELQNETISQYLDSLASSSPAPGGGTVAGATGAQMAALISMVCNLTTGKKKFLPVEKEVLEILEVAETSRNKFIALANEDQTVFKNVITAYKLPKETSEEKEVRSYIVNQALIEAANVPLQMIEETLKLYPLCIRLLEIGNPNLVSDLGIATHLIRATVDSSVLNVLINIVELTDSAQKADLTEKIKEYLSQIKTFETTYLDKFPSKLKL